MVTGFAAAVTPLLAGPFGSADLGLTYLAATAHKAYAHALILGGGESVIAARQWISAAERALREPNEIDLPHAVTIGSEAGMASATGLRFAVSTGRRIDVKVIAAGGDAEGRVFVELFDIGGSIPHWLRTVPARVAADSTETAFEIVWEGLEDKELLVRVQPDLGYDGEIAVELTQSPLLGFPVKGHSMRSIQSGFGAERDGGRRAHRGADIFADRGTEVVASLDGWVSRVDTTPRGGNVIWLQPLYGNLRLYYAHLDSQLVAEGDFVRAGDVLGTVGNTGNAITTPPHLHYGVYLRRRGARGGARDPVGFLR